METTFNNRKYFADCYRLDVARNLYLKDSKQFTPIRCNHLPYEMKLDQTRAADIKRNAELCLLRSNGKDMYTGLQELPFSNWYIGNHYNPRAQKKRSDILFNFSPVFDTMTAFYFPGFNSANKQLREQFALELIPYFKQIYSL